MIKYLKYKSKKNNEKVIYNTFAEKMLLLCYRYLNNIMDAEEAMHNGFIKVFANIKRFKPKHENSFEAWIKKIMINECLMFLRKKVNFTLIAIDEIKEQGNKAFESTTNFEVETYLELINELPVGYKTVFNLYAIEGYAHKEIAEILKISESTSRSQLTKARKLLQTKIIKKESLYA